MSLLYPKSAFKSSDLWSIAQEATRLLRVKLSDSSLSVRVVNTNFIDDGSVSQWQVRSKDRNGQSYIVYAYPIIAPYFDVDRVTNIIASHDRVRNPDAHKMLQLQENKQKQKDLDESNEIVAEGNWEVGRQLRREYIFS